MRKGTFISILALMVAVVGAIVAFAAYFKYRNCVLCDDFDEDDMPDDDLSDLDYYATPVHDSSDEDSDEDSEESDPPAQNQQEVPSTHDEF